MSIHLRKAITTQLLAAADDQLSHVLKYPDNNTKKRFTISFRLLLYYSCWFVCAASTIIELSV